MKRMRAWAGACVLLSASLAAQAGSETPLRSIGQRSFLHGTDSYTVVEALESADQSIYIRTDQAGRFLGPEERQALLTLRNFEGIRESAPWRAAASSVLLFDGASHSRILPAESDPHTRDWTIRGLKLILLGLTVFAYNGSQSAASDLSGKIRYLNNTIAEARLRRYNNLYYISLTVLLGTTIWFAADAYFKFGLYPDGRDAEIQRRVEAPLQPGSASASPSTPSSLAAGQAATFQFGIRW